MATAIGVSLAILTLLLFVVVVIVGAYYWNIQHRQKKSEYNLKEDGHSNPNIVTTVIKNGMHSLKFSYITVKKTNCHND